jgi:hypothetical protein
MGLKIENIVSVYSVEIDDNRVVNESIINYDTHWYSLSNLIIQCVMGSLIQAQ